jgi:hypothetical protein
MKLRFHKFVGYKKHTTMVGGYKMDILWDISKNILKNSQS